MKCCVSSCSSTNTIYSNSKGITFHKFPIDKVRREAWFAVLGIDESQLPDSPVVCSLHFKDENFYEGKNGLRVVQRCAVPFVQVCVVCLDTESKLYPLRKYNLEHTYEAITGLALQDLTNFTPTVCPECAQRLINCHQFREKSLRGHTVLLALIKKHELLTVPYIKTINRSHNNFTSNLVKKTFKPNHRDRNFIDSKEEDTRQDETEMEIEEKEEKPLVKVEKQESVLVFETVAINEKAKDANLKELSQRVIKNDVNEDIDIDFLNDDYDKDDDFFNNADDDVSNDSANRALEVKNDKQSVKNKREDSDSEVELVSKIENDSDIEEIKRDENNEKSQNKVNRTLKRTRKVNFKNGRNGKVSNAQIKKNKNLTRKVSGAKTRSTNPRAVKSDTKVNLKKSNLVKPDPGASLTLFEMTKLTHEEQIQDVEKRKESSNYKFSSFQCNFCYRGFICNSTYTRHMEKHSKAFGNVECPICKKYFKDRSSLAKHTKSHTTRYNCTQCEFFSMNLESARMHERWHKGSKYKCPQCDDEFSKYTTYITHLRVKHPSDFICSHCGYSFISQKGLEFHIYRTHRLDKVALQEELTGPRCEECNIRFASDTAYEQHMKVSPKHHKPETGVRNQLLPRRRYKKGSGTTYVTCEQCGMQLKDFTIYMFHFKREHPGETQTQHALRPRECLCEQCGRSFQTAFHLKDHMTKHTGQKNFQCNVCDKRFRTKAFLDKHKETHATTRKLHKCHVCCKTFTSPSSRNRHLLIHKEKAYKCDICEKAFSNGSDRNTHVSHVHLKVPWPKRNRGSSGKATRPEKEAYDE